MNAVTTIAADTATDRAIRYAIRETTLGPVLIAASDAGVCCVAFEESEAELQVRFPGRKLLGHPAQSDASFATLVEEVVAAIERPAIAQDIPLDIQGTVFQHDVWQALRDIPAGETRSYGDLAATLGNPKASRAVGGANAANRIAVLIPCHRVIAADGGLGGYAYGSTIKTELLHRERTT